MYYVYAHTKPSGEIFYIGKGKKKRAYSKNYRNRHWNFIVQKYGFESYILAEFQTEKEALAEEVLLIAHFKKFGKLTNITKGGDDNPMNTPEVAKQMAETKRARGQYGTAFDKYNESYKEKIKDVEFSKRISESRKRANLISIEKRHQLIRVQALEVHKLKQSGLTVKQIKELMNFSEGKTYDLLREWTPEGVWNA